MRSRRPPPLAQGAGRTSYEIASFDSFRTRWWDATRVGLEAVIVERATVALDAPPAGYSERYPHERRALAAFAEWVLDPARDSAARAVQRAWRRCVADPAFLACRRRLRREFATM